MRLPIAGALVAFLVPTSASLADTAFDGVWRVDVSAQTEDARCKERSVSLRVEDGQVSYDGFLSGLAEGSVDPSGQVDVRIARISVDGRLSQSSGSGAWRSKNCVGTWQARRA